MVLIGADVSSWSLVGGAWVASWGDAVGEVDVCVGGGLSKDRTGLFVTERSEL